MRKGTARYEPAPYAIQEETLQQIAADHDRMSWSVAMHELIAAAAKPQTPGGGTGTFIAEPAKTTSIVADISTVASAALAVRQVWQPQSFTDYLDPPAA